MTPKSYPALERALTDGLSRYLLNRVNKHTRRVEWLRVVSVDESVPVEGWDEAERVIGQIVEEAVEAQLTEVCEWFDFE